MAPPDQINSNYHNEEEDERGSFLTTVEVPEIGENLEDGTSSDDSSLLIDETAKKYSALDALITRIGIGKFQKQLLVLCGFGWLADNMWLQCIAVILPRVQVHYDVESRYIGALSSSVFIGMMFGALFWGVLSDSNGRKQAFNWTLAVTALFGFFSSLAQSFAQLCFMLFLLGFGVGGNMPVDGALFLEFIPKEHQYLLTFLSVFFSFGAVLTSIVAYLVLPPFSCPEVEDVVKKCVPEIENNGWRYMLAILGFLTFLMLVARLLFFRLQESPKYLISNNRKDDAELVLRKIVRINGSNMQIRLNDFPTTPNPSTTAIPYRATASRGTDFVSHSINYFKQMIGPKLRTVKPLFTPKWIVTTLLVWCIWGIVAFAYTMYNVFLPMYLEKLGNSHAKGDGHNSMKEALEEYLIYSIAGVPGSVIGAYLIETPLGRKGTMSLSTFGTSLAVYLFTSVYTPAGVIMSSAMVSFLATLTYAVIYGYTPEVFEAKLRGTACGISSAIGRIAGIVSPILTGALFSISYLTPLYCSAILFGISGVCMVMLPIETRGRQA